MQRDEFEGGWRGAAAAPHADTAARAAPLIGVVAEKQTQCTTTTELVHLGRAIVLGLAQFRVLGRVLGQ